MNSEAANELRLVSAVLDDRAARIEASAEALVAHAMSASWAGPAADRFRALMAQRRNEMRAGAAALREAAGAIAAVASGGAT